MIAEGIAGKRMLTGAAPGRIAVLRLHAFGDAAITLPLVAAVRARFPGAELVFITSTPYADLFQARTDIDRVLPVRTVGPRAVRAAAAVRAGLRVGRCDLLLDLQRSRQSALIRQAVRPAAWAAFDRFAPRAALDRYLDAAQWVGLDTIAPVYGPALRADVVAGANAILEASAGTSAGPWVCLNPAGCWPTKNWPIEEYVAVGRELIGRWGARVLLLGTEHVRSGANAIACALGADAVNLVGRTSTAQALALVARSRLVVSDDSGLMHLAWVAGVPTIGVFGATRAAWSRPYGDHSAVFGSEDLACGACMSPACARGDMLCLRRVDAAMVIRTAEGLAG